MHFLSISYFKRNKSNIKILLERLPKIKKVDFVLSFYYLKVVFSKKKNNNIEKKEKLKIGYFLIFFGFFVFTTVFTIFIIFDFWFI